MRGFKDIYTGFVSSFQFFSMIGFWNRRRQGARSEGLRARGRAIHAFKGPVRDQDIRVKG